MVSVSERGGMDSGTYRGSASALSLLTSTYPHFRLFRTRHHKLRPVQQSPCHSGAQ
jgi:hypothetical protein